MARRPAQLPVEEFSLSKNCNCEVALSDQDRDTVYSSVSLWENLGHLSQAHPMYTFLGSSLYILVCLSVLILLSP